MSIGTDDISHEAAAEYLRIAIPLMSRRKVPATPQNYATWYAYVSGTNPQLNDEIDRLVAEGGEFDMPTNMQLYRQYVSEQNVDYMERIRSDLTKLISDVGSTLLEASNDAGAFEGALGGFVRQTENGDDLSAIRRLLESLITETRTMRTATTRMQSEFESKSREIEELQQKLQQERTRAITDPLTGLHNRLSLIEQLNAAISEAGDGGPPSLIMLDIDHFKSVNDTHGHLIGDRVIRFVAQVLQKNIKGKDTAARYGGEEFTVLLPATPVQGAAAVAEAICKAVAGAQLVRADNKKALGTITLSAGVAAYRQGEEIVELIDRADQALYRAKKEGRNRISLA